MSRRVVIIGASGHGKVVADIIRCSGDEVLGFLDDDTTLPNTFIGLPLLGTVDSYKAYDAEFVIAIGNEKIRERITKKLVVTWYTAIHPSAVIAESASIGEGSVVMANAVINPGSVVGKHCIINSSAVVEHDNRISDFVHVSVGAKLAGNVKIGKGTWIGIGATVSNNVNICGGCMIGAGAVVIKHIDEPGTYVGFPVWRIEMTKNNSGGGTTVD